MPALVAVDLAGGPAFVDALRRVWDAGDAALPVDQQLDQAARRDLCTRMGAAAVLGPDGTSRLDPSAARPVEDGDALVVCTSGSSGVPKGVVLTHAAVQASAAATSARLGVTAADHWLACLPLHHVGGLSVVTRALHAGTSLTVLPRFDADAVARVEATLVSLVTATLRRVDPSRYRRIVLGGARPPDVVPVNVVTTYGMTESGSGVVYDGVPLDGVEVRIVDGAIELRGPMMLRAYRDGTDPRHADGWYPTGDMGSLDDDNRLHVTGRADEMIVSGGENVWPQVVERALAGFVGVADLAIAGTPDPQWGAVVTAHVVVADGAEPPALAALRERVAATLPRACEPRRLVIHGALPRTSTGKVARWQLR